MTKYKVVRSYTPDSEGSSTKLEQAFNDGWEFVRASEFIPPTKYKSGYIEYILKKEVPYDGGKKT